MAMCGMQDCTGALSPDPHIIHPDMISGGSCKFCFRMFSNADVIAKARNCDLCVHAEEEEKPIVPASWYDTDEIETWNQTGRLSKTKIADSIAMGYDPGSVALAPPLPSATTFTKSGKAMPPTPPAPPSHAAPFQRSPNIAEEIAEDEAESAKRQQAAAKSSSPAIFPALTPPPPPSPCAAKPSGPAVQVKVVNTPKPPPSATKFTPGGKVAPLIPPPFASAKRGASSSFSPPPDPKKTTASTVDIKALIFKVADTPKSSAAKPSDAGVPVGKAKLSLAERVLEEGGGRKVARPRLIALNVLKPGLTEIATDAAAAMKGPGYDWHRHRV
jgi:hypothetical protein